VVKIQKSFEPNEMQNTYYTFCSHILFVVKPNHRSKLDLSTSRGKVFSETQTDVTYINTNQFIIERQMLHGQISLGDDDP